MFEKASRLKLRFESSKGLLTVEDLWDLPLTSRRAGTSLDDLAKNINRQLKEDQEESFVERSTKNTELELAFDIIKHIITVRLAENDAKRVLAENKAKKEKLLEVIARKEDAAYDNMDINDLKRMVEEL
jgi:hypothetical protein